MVTMEVIPKMNLRTALEHLQVSSLVMNNLCIHVIYIILLLKRTSDDNLEIG